MKIYSAIWAMTIVIISATSCYAAGPWRGKVISVETKQPIEDAVVVAVWEKEWAGLGAGADTQFLDASETVTDKSGVFEIPSKSFLSVPYFRKVKGPYFTIYKPGYGSYPRYQVSPKYTPIELFEGQGATIELPEMKTKDERIKSLHGAEATMDDIPKTRIKKLLELINMENRSLGFDTYQEDKP